METPNYCLNTLSLVGAPASEIDLSSPLNYGTPDSRTTGTPRTPGIGATPIRQRPDVRSDRKMRQVALSSSDGSVRDLVYMWCIIIYFCVKRLHLHSE